MKNVVITGASSGIGRETAKLFLSEGNRVYCLSRRPSDLYGIINIECDITDEAQVEKAFEQIPEIDILFNNAGYGIAGATEFVTMEDMRAQFELNLFAQVSVTQKALPKLKKSKGKIIFVSSAAAPFPIPFQSLYSATKSAIETVACALKNELKMFSVDVSCVRLGDVKTAFTAKRDKNFAGDDVYGGQINRSVSKMEIDEINGMPASIIAETVVNLTKKRVMPPIVTIGLEYKFLCFVNDIFPKRLVNWVIGKMYMPKK